ncbi:hypothetical protein DFJ58DRAFT_737535 [Suillus subalutaceus]|uniref:uncharacterized protein n=1 Tax=Suillus subalutaceus TaxID=48586 RepID=UPI001B87214F|nr:uncharacterized protein DFJ58DRAFT_737535 [Suillus subalutaceus]KAG1829019.1 hypothetical protein DFJ58DRAFT_737535 [Suillus subalutaceus]
MRKHEKGIKQFINGLRAIPPGHNEVVSKDALDLFLNRVKAIEAKREAGPFIDLLTDVSDIQDLEKAAGGNNCTCDNHYNVETGGENIRLNMAITSLFAAM